MVNKYRIIVGRIDSISNSRIVLDDGKVQLEALSGDGSTIAEICFDDAILTRTTDEGTRLRLLQGILEPALILQDEQSQLITWLAEETLQTRDLKNAKHFLVFLGEEIVDVVSYSEPVLRRQQVAR